MLENKQILKIWKSYIQATALEKSKIHSNEDHRTRSFQFTAESIEHEDSNYVYLNLNSEKINAIQTEYSKTIKETKQFFLLFPLIEKNKKLNGKWITVKYPLFMFNISHWLEHKKEDEPLKLPTSYGTDIIPLKNVFSNPSLLDFNLDEFKSNLYFHDFIETITGKKCDDFISLLTELNYWIDSLLSNKNVKRKTSYNAIISEFNNFDITSKKLIEDYSHLCGSASIDNFPLLNHYLYNNANSNMDKVVPNHPSYGLFESKYQLGIGQMEAISEVNNGKILTTVQGAPGTGKTTLFKSLIANQIVNKALSIINQDHKKHNMLITSTAIKAVENVINDLKEDDCTKNLDWLYFQGGNKMLIQSECQRIESLVNEIGNEDYDSSKQDKIQENILDLKTLIYQELENYKKINKNLNDNFTLSGYSTIEELKTKLNLELSKLHELVSKFGLPTEKNTNLKLIEFWLENQLITNKKEYSFFEKSSSKIKFWKTFAPRVLNIELIPEWLNSDLCNSVITGFSKYPRKGLKSLWIKLFPGAYKVLALRINGIYADEISNLMNTTVKISDFVELAIFSKNIKKENWESTINNLNNSRIDKNFSQLNNIQSQFEKTVHIENTYNKLEKLLVRKTELYPEGFWLDVQRKRYVSENRKLFELSIQFLWQEILKNKEIIKDSLLHWKDMLLGNKASGYYKYKSKLDEFYLNISLAYPVVIGPLASLYKLPGYELKHLDNSKPFDYCLCDEAGMISVETLIPALCRSNNAIVVGDPLQLQPIRTLSEYTSDQLHELHFNNMPDEYEKLSPMQITSYHRAAGTLTGDVHEIGEGIVLEEHRRCQQPIADLFVKIADYKNIEIISIKPEERILNAFKNLGGFHKMFYSVQGQSDNLPNTNIDEVDAICEILTKLKLAGYDLYNDVGIITPYSNQRNLLVRKLGKALNHSESQKIGTVHQFQGIEFQVIIYSSVIYSSTHSTTYQNRTPNLLNVAISRAKQQFIVVGNYHKLVDSGSYLKIMAEECSKDFLLEMELQSPSYLNIIKSKPQSRCIFDCDHLDVFESEITNAKSSIKIIVPWIRSNCIHPQLKLIEKALNSGIEIKVFYGFNNLRYNDEDGDKFLIEKYKKVLGNNLIRLPEGTHEKIIIRDDKIAIVGSWNWLSHNYYKYCKNDKYTSMKIRKETSLITNDESVLFTLLENLQK